jgi:ribosomal protein L40E
MLNTGNIAILAALYLFELISEDEFDRRKPPANWKGPKKIICPKCGAEYPTYFTYCGQCGQQFL